jgi:lactate permease
MWEHNYQPIGDSLGLSAIVAAIPIIVLFVMLGALRKPAWMSAMSALGSALIIALVAYGMPARLAITSTIFGAAFGMFPIAWIVFSSIMLYRLAVDTGKFEIIKSSIGGLTDDRRLQAMFIAFSFGAFIEGAAGFGAPVAVSGSDARRTRIQPVLRCRYLPACEYCASGFRIHRYAGHYPGECHRSAIDGSEFNDWPALRDAVGIDTCLFDGGHGWPQESTGSVARYSSPAAFRLRVCSTTCRITWARN